MLKSIKSKIKHTWEGPGTIINGSSLIDVLVMTVNDGELKRKLKYVMKDAWRQTRKFSLWLVAATVLPIIGFFVTHLLSKWIN